MNRDPNGFDWGLGGPPASGDQPSLAQRLQKPVVAPDDSSTSRGVSYDPHDLGFEEQEVPRKSLARRIIPPIIILSILGGLVVTAAVGADKFARSAVTGVIQGKVAETLKIANENDVKVDLGDGPFIGQAVTGSIDDVTVRVPDATFNGYTGALTIRATGVPTDQTEPESLAISLTLEGDNAKQFAQQLRPSSRAKVLLRDGAVTVSRSFNGLPAAIAYIPTVEDGKIVLTPDKIRIDNNPMSIGEFIESPFGKAGASLTEQRTVCVADKLPAKLTLDSITVEKDSFAIAASGSGVALSSAGLTTLGVCEKE